MEFATQNPNIAEALTLLDHDVPTFNQVKGFSTGCKDALKDAVNEGSFERLADFLAEVEVGRIFFKTGLLERYEAPLGPTEKKPSKKKPLSCDWLVTVNNERIWLEVKRIRRTRTEVAFQKRIREVAERIRTTPSPFFVGLSLDSFDLQPPAVDRIVEEITKTLAEMKAEDSHVEERSIWLNDNEEETRIGIFSVSSKGKYSPDEATAFSCLSYRIPYSDSGGEQGKFWGDLAGKKGKGAKLQKLPEGEAGFIFFWVDSITYEEIDLLGLLVREDDFEQTKWQIEDFFKEYKKVTGVILRAEQVIASATSSGSIHWGPTDQKRYKIHWTPWAENKLSDATATMLIELLG